ncbi:MAG TPA: PEGA domain-containing protein [Terriglobia bacterium]|nr:PEGA domain-containing protein [Terriglobia bacterium]
MKSYGARHICAILGGAGMFLLMASGCGLAAQGTAVPLALQDGTPVKLRLTQTISSSTAQVNDTVPLEVLGEVKVGNLVVIKNGAMAWGTVTEAQAKRRMGKGGKLNVNIDAVRLADGEKAALRAVRNTKGGGHTGAMTAGIVATSLIVWPAAPFFLFMHGKDVTIPEGTAISAYINGDFPIDAAKFELPQAGQQGPAPSTAPPHSSGATGPPAPAQTAQYMLRSNPPGADITVDGSFVGNTPSTLRLTPGQHTIALGESGFQTWQRTVTATAGTSITVDAKLEKVQ